jgi:hypothetical protein
VIYPCNGILLSLKRKKLLPGTVSMSIVPATKKAEARETLEPGSELLGTSLGNIASPCLKIKQ